MMNIAIVTFANLPIPAVKGGAVETLIDNIIDENEKYKKLYITTYSVYSNEAIKTSQRYKHTVCKFYNKKKFIPFCLNYIKRFVRKISMGKFEYISWFMEQIITDINKNHFDYVVIAGGGVLVPQLKKHIKCGLIIYFHGDPLDYLTEEKLREIINCTSKIFCVSNFVAERVMSVDKMCKDKISVILNCNDLIELPKDDYLKIRSEKRAELSILEDDIIIIYIGRIIPIKGVKELLLSFKLLKNKKVKLLIVGSSWSGTNKKSDYFNELQKIAGFMSDRIFFTGYIPHKELSKYYAVADIAIVPSTCNEAAPLSVIEALSMGVPLIASKMGGIPEYCDNSNSILIDYNEDFINNLYKAINELSENTAKRIDMKKSAKLYATKFDKKSYYNAFISEVVK